MCSDRGNFRVQGMIVQGSKRLRENQVDCTASKTVVRGKSRLSNQYDD